MARTARNTISSALQGDKGVMTSYDYLDGGTFQPSDEDVRKRRPADTQ